MSKRFLMVLLSLSLATPAFAGDRDDFGRGYYPNAGAYYSGYGRPREYGEHHFGGRGFGTAAAIVGGLILGAAIANSGQTRSSPNTVYAQPVYTPRCYDRQVTEQTVSGRYVTYTERVCD